MFYWFVIDPRTMILTQKAKISDPALSLLFPTMAVHGHGNVGFGVTGASASPDAWSELNS
jgi:hypothetical protein